jgi:hypothetical protein
MHNSQNGIMEDSNGPQENLLKLSCIGCHARTFNDSTGRASSAGGPAAPQVGPLAVNGSYQLSGGYFSTTANATTHNVADIPGTAPDSLITSNSAPGGTFALQDGAKPKLRCNSCHDSAIRHAAAGSERFGTAASSYRMLHGTTAPLYVKGTGAADFEAGATQNLYDALSINRFCALCHGLFHSLTNTDSIGDGNGAWVRHPTDVSTSDIINGPSPNYEGGDKVVPLGDAGAVAAGHTNQVMCLSCHRAHGNANSDMLRFNYNVTGNLAGDVAVSQGCETCHGAK